MGDHRMNIKIEIEFHGVKQKTDMWINYIKDSMCETDRRIIEFIDGVYQKGMKVYNKDVEQYFAKEHAKEIESEERAELKRLQDKYNTPHKDTA